MEKASKSKDSVIIDLNQQIELLKKQVDGVQKKSLQSSQIKICIWPSKS